MSEHITPLDFASEQPPQRIIGSECEYNIQAPPSVTRSYFAAYIAGWAIQKAGYEAYGSYLSNGGRLYADVGHLEYATPECLGPRQATAADFAGIEVLRRVVKATGNSHNGIFRIAGMNPAEYDQRLPLGGHTSGYHENYMMPREIAYRDATIEFLPTFLASRVWAMGGSLQRTGYALSQKINGIGGFPIDNNLNRRTNSGDKPMVHIPKSYDDADVISGREWARIEVRYADPLQSKIGRFLSFASTSLALRLLEHADKLPSKALHALTFRDQVRAAQYFAYDTSFTATHMTVYDRRMTALDVGEACIELITGLSEKVALPQDELDALPIWGDTIDRMRASSFDRGEYYGLENMLDIAAKHRYISKRTSNMRNNNVAAATRSLLWDRVMPEGAGSIWWDSKPNDIIDPAEIDRLVTTPPRTRARRRVKRIRRRANTLKGLNWATTTDKDDRQTIISDAYGVPMPTRRPLDEN